jgi:beta-lactamase class A
MTALGLKVSGLFTEGLPVTADDIGVLIEAIARTPDLDTESKQQMLDLMLAETIDNGLAAGVPAGTRVAHKTGNWPDATHDAGIVLAPGKDYVLVVLSDLGYATVLTRSISELVYSYFSSAR